MSAGSSRMLCAGIFVVLGFGGSGSFVYGRPTGDPQDLYHGQVPYPGSMQESPLTFQGEQNPLGKASGSSRMYPYYPPPTILKDQPLEQASSSTSNDANGQGQGHAEVAKRGNTATDGNNFHNPFFNSPKNSDTASGKDWRPQILDPNPWKNSPGPDFGSDESNKEAGSGVGPLSDENMEDDLGVPIERPLTSEEEDLGLSPYLRERKPPQLPFQPTVSGSRLGNAPRVRPRIRANGPTTFDSEDSGSLPDDVSDLISWEELMDKDVGVDWPIASKEYVTTKPNQKVRVKANKAAKRGSSSSSTTEHIKGKHRKHAKQEEEEMFEGLVSEDGVPIELAISVIEAMNAEPEWRRKNTDLDPDYEPWAKDDDEDSDSEEDTEWIPVESMYPQGSRLMGLIIETIGGSNAAVDELKHAQNEDNDMLEIFSNFPFQMLFGVKNDDGNTNDNDDDEEDEDDEYYDEYYDDYENDSDDENYAVSLEDANAKNLEQNEYESGESDLAYSDEYDDVSFVEEKKGELSIIAVLSPLMG